MITNQVLGTVLLGVNEQINCTDCISAFGSAGSFSAGVHGRKDSPAISRSSPASPTRNTARAATTSPGADRRLRAALRFHRLGLVAAVLRCRHDSDAVGEGALHTQLRDQPRRGMLTVRPTPRITRSTAAPGGSAAFRRATRSPPPSRSGSCGSGSTATPTRRSAFNPFDATIAPAPTGRTSSRSAASGRI